uniref:Uncharacterized protein n=2 Tax=Phaeomonas parva TaxID=124430 RepID=A0A6U4F3V5_9STRA|mmetsp:Transcript_23811/g.74936  ORF Transcript_23811/g.74936 Transcript_23811/m.74936 type:complete len:317 (+) Transcript_23811:125-1075(+)
MPFADSLAEPIRPESPSQAPTLRNPGFVRHEQKWQCANCKTIYDALDVLQYHHESGKFYCPRCSLVAGRLATPFFLEQTHTNQEEEEVLDLQRKIGEQLNGEDGLRPSLYDLIGRARAVEDQLPYNHPYETSRYREEFKINSRRSPNPDQQLAFARAGLGYGGGATGNGGANGGPANGGGELRSTSPMPGGSLFENSAIFAHVDVPQGPPPEMMRADYAVEVTLDSTGNAVESKLTEVETVHEQREHALPGFLKDARATMMQATSLARENEAKPEAAAAPAPPAPAAAAPAAAAAASATPAAVDDDDDDSDVEWED